jgi:hypothetical protein
MVGRMPALSSLLQPQSPKVLTVSATARPETKSDWNGMLEIAITIEPTFHVNSNTPTTEFLIPTAVKFKVHPTVTFGPAKYPRGLERRFEFSDEKLSIYEGRTVIQVPYRVAPSSPANGLRIQGILSYQACTEKACLPPRTEDFEVSLPPSK